jgi:hypothetical protein
MRTIYPTPSFSDGYQYKLVDSTFIHAIHLARECGTWNYVLGVSFQENQDEIKWYLVSDPKGLFKKLTDPKQSPGFTFNNSVKGKPFETTNVPKDNTKYIDESLAKVKKDVAALDTQYNRNTSPEAIRLLEAWKQRLNAQGAPKTNAKGFTVPKVDPTPLPKDSGPCTQSGYGALLDVCQDTAKSSCISYLAMGYNRQYKNFVVYFALKTQSTNILAFTTDDASTYRNWTNAESLGRFYNRNIKQIENVFSVRAAAKA